MQRLKINMKALYSGDFVAYSFGGADWNYFLYDYTLDATYTPYTQDIMIGTTQSATTANIGSKEFIYPLPIKHKTIIDGVIRGFVKIKYKTSDGAANHNVYIEKILITIKAIDSDGTKREIEKHNISTSLQTNSTTGEIESVPFFFDVSDEELEYNERILVEISLYGKMDNVADTGTFYLSCEINKEDLLVIMPIV